MQLYNMSFRPCELTSSIFIISVELEVMIHDSLIKGTGVSKNKTRKLVWSEAHAYNVIPNHRTG